MKMYVSDSSTPLLTRYYVGDRYEYDQTSGGTKGVYTLVVTPIQPRWCFSVRMEGTGLLTT